MLEDLRWRTQPGQFTAMGAPRDLVLVRHGQSEGNVACAAGDRNNESLYIVHGPNTSGRYRH